MIAWHVYPLGFVGAPIQGEAAPAPRLERLTEWVGYAADLGADTLSLGPVFASQSHGYDTVDYGRIDPRLGDESDFARLIEACHAHQLKVLVDGVFNHVGAAHPLYQRARAGDPEAARCFVWHDGQAQVFEGHGALISLNHDEPAVVAMVQDVMRHWMRLGVDGWRFDAAYAVGPAFFSQVLPPLRAEFPEAYCFGEIIHGDYAGFVAQSGVDSVTQYELWKSIWSSILDRNFFELSWTLARHNDLLDSFVPVTFVGNHDVTRITSRVGPAGAAVALVALMSLGGSPHLYYGDEWGFTGLKEERIGGDDAIRPAFPPSVDGLPVDETWVYQLHLDLIGLRRSYPWLERARSADESLDNTRYVYRVSDPASEAALRVTLDLSDPDHLSAQVATPAGEELIGFRS